MNEKNITELYRKYQNGTLTNDEQQEWRKVIADYNLEDQLSSIIGKEWDREDLEAPAIAAEELSRIFRQITAHPQGEASLQKKYWLHRIVTAACLALVFMGVTIWFYQKQTKPNLATIEMRKNEINPGKQAGTLTLADGTTINLAESKTGEISKESGISINKSAEGHLVYKISPNGDKKNDEGGTNTLFTDKGQTYQIQLPDGSKVWLNASSSLIFTTQLIHNGKRTVKLNGEGYFEIAKDKKHPFVVETEHQAVEVLGTHFNISAYESEAQTKTTLLEGSVKIRTAQSTALLSPGQQALSDKGKIAIKTLPSAQQAVAWKNGEFQFDNLPLREIMAQIGRWYDVEISYANNVVDPGFGGTIQRTKGIKDVLRVLEKTQGIHFKIEGRRVLVMP